MSKNKKYDVARATEAQFEPGSRKQVLKNLMGIKSKSQMNEIEAVALKQAEDLLFHTYRNDHRFSSDDLCKIHKVWLGKIYGWAGKYRNIDLSKGRFRFAHAKHIPSLMDDLEKNFLSQLTPCLSKSKDGLIMALARIHAEFILIHPFREGNGRIGRILATLMAVQAGFPPLNFEIIEKKKHTEYIMAIQASVHRNYEPIEEIFRLILESSQSR
jgi:cell filamentation protein